MSDNSTDKIPGKTIKCGLRTFFFDIKKAKNEKKFLIITESRFDKETQKHKRSSILLFEEDLEKFKTVLGEISLIEKTG